MSNLIITTKCNNRCKFCFIDSKCKDQTLTVQKLFDMLPFIESFHRDGMNILGGEPTLNPDFLEILNLFLHKNLKINIFTNGKLNIDLVSKLQTIFEGEFSFCVNRSNHDLTPEIIQFYRKLGHKITLSLTVYSLNQKITHILDEIMTYRLAHQYRIGIALPIWPERHNLYLHPHNYELAAGKIFQLIQKGVSLGIIPNFDCGFPYCFFNENQRQYFQENHIEFQSICGIIPDICPDSWVIPCFPLFKFKQKISNGLKWQDMIKKFEVSLKNCDYQPIFEKCNDCNEIQKGKCNGGCAALRITNLVNS